MLQKIKTSDKKRNRLDSIKKRTQSKKLKIYSKNGRLS